MRAIYCLGEDTSDLSDQALENVLGEQVKSLIDFPFNHLIVAYEPKWAIGTGRDAPGDGPPDGGGATHRAPGTQGDHGGVRPLHPMRPSTASPLSPGAGELLHLVCYG